MIIAEGVILAGFDIQPIRVGEVLGESTSSFIEEIEKRTYPATYYVSTDAAQTSFEAAPADPRSKPESPEEIESREAEDATIQNQGEEVLDEVSKENALNTEKTEEQTTPKAEEEVQEVMDVLNSAFSNSVSESEKQGKEEYENSVDLLIRKNKRLYHHSIKKALEEISGTLGVD